MSITPESLLTLEAYARLRPELRRENIAHRRLRSLRLGELMRLHFEDERTVRYQIQEMLRAERIFEPDAIEAEIATYAPLVPDGGNWKATLMIEVADAAERCVVLSRLVGVESRLYVEVAGAGRARAEVIGEGVDAAAERTSAVHFVRFEFTGAQRAALGSGGACVVGCDHPHYEVRVPLEGPLLCSLLGDLGLTGDVAHPETGPT